MALYSVDCIQWMVLPLLMSLSVILFINKLQIVLGKCKSLSPGTGDENVEPTPNFDCHIPQMPARPSDSFYQQLSRSQVRKWTHLITITEAAVFIQ